MTRNRTHETSMILEEVDYTKYESQFVLKRLIIQSTNLNSSWVSYTYTCNFDRFKFRNLFWRDNIMHRHITNHHQQFSSIIGHHRTTCSWMLSRSDKSISILVQKEWSKLLGKKRVSDVQNIH